MGTMSNNLFFAIQLAEYEEKLEREKEAYEKALKKGKNNNFYFAINCIEFVLICFHKLSPFGKYNIYS